MSNDDLRAALQRMYDAPLYPDPVLILSPAQAQAYNEILLVHEANDRFGERP